MQSLGKPQGNSTRYEVIKTREFALASFASLANLTIMSLSKSVQEPCVEQALASSRKGTVFFPFKLPKNGLALRSVSIAGGVAKLHFVASSKVPTISEQDVATAFRLAKEDKRPCFFYYPFPFSHPLHTSRFFMKWFPAWLKETGIGELLAGADWNMKCLHVGVRTNKEKTVFKSWPKSSNLQGLATKLDFPTNDTFISTSIMMSCDHAKVQKSDNEIYFPEEPSMKITDETNSLYSKYITEIYRSVGYHDEPLLLKMQELIKLILAVEWLYKEKGVRVDEDWMTKHTCSPKDPIKVAAQVEFSKRKEPPYDMIPRLDVYKRPSSDVTVKTWEAEMYRRLETKHRVNRCYGYYNNAAGELIMFREDGEAGMHIPLNCLKLDVKHNMMMIEASVCSYSPFPAKLPLMAEIREKILPSLLKHSCETTSFPLPVSVDTTVDGSTSDEEMELKLVRLLQPSPQLSLPPLKQTTDMRATVVSYDKVFASVDPNQPLVPPVPGIREGIVPKVESWSELVSEWSVPIPRIWQVPFVGVGEPAASGGVTTQNFTVQKEQLQESVAYNEIQRSGNYTSSANMITVEAQQANSAAQQRVEEIPRRRNRRKRNRSHRTAEAQRNNGKVFIMTSY